MCVVGVIRSYNGNETNPPDGQLTKDSCLKICEILHGSFLGILELFFSEKPMKIHGSN